MMFLFAHLTDPREFVSAHLRLERARHQVGPVRDVIHPECFEPEEVRARLAALAAELEVIQERGDVQ